MSERLGTQLQSGGLEQSIHTGLLGKGMFAGASLDLNFAVTKNIGPLVTFTRASTATFVDSAGVLQTAATDVPRFNHNPTTGESLGLLVEEARTNLLLNSATLSTQSVTVTAAAHTLSFTGTGTITLSGVSTAGPLVGTGAGEGNRVSLTFTPTAGTLTLTVSGTVSNAQLEVGSFRTSYIPTTTAAATRSADVASITGSNFGVSRTNYIRNNTMVGAGAGTPGTNPNLWLYASTQSNGLTVSIVGTGVENGINYIDYRFNGTTVASPAGCTIGFDNASAATGQTWTQSLYWKLAAGTATGVNNWQLGIIENTAASVFVAGAFYTQAAPTANALITQRPVATRTLSGGATVGLVSATLNIPVVGNTAIDFTLRIGLPQLELGSTATAPIPTTSAAVTVFESSWYRQDEGTVFVEARTNATHGGTNSFPRVFALNDGGNNNSIEGYFRVLSSYTDAGYRVDAVGVNQAQFDTNDQRNGQRQSIGYAVNNFAFVVGGATVNADTSGSVPVTTQLRLGARGDGSSIANGTIRRLVYWGQRLPNNVLQAITQ